MESADKDRVRKDLSSYERNKKIHSLGNIAMLSSLAGTGVGAWRGNKALIGTGLGTAFVSGFIRGKAKNKERSALNRIKRYYDLREKTAGIWDLLKHGPRGSFRYGPIVSAVGVGADVVGLAGGIPPVWSHAIALGSAMAAPAASMTGDYLSIGRMTDRAQKEVATITAATIKKGLGKQLSEAEELAYHVGNGASLASKAFNKRPDGFTKRLLRHYNIGVNGGQTMGYNLGKDLLPVFKHINKIDPSLTDDLIHAASTNDMGKLHDIYKRTVSEYTPAASGISNELKSALGNFPSLNKEMKASGESIDSLIKKTVSSKGRNIEGVAKRINISAKNLADSGKNIDMAISNIPGATVAKKLLGKGSGQIIGETVSSNAVNIKNLSELILAKSKRVRPTLGAIGAAGVLALIGSMAGKHRSIHPLRKDENILKLLPSLQAKKEAV